MRGSDHFRALVRVVAILFFVFFGCLPLPAQCRPGLLGMSEETAARRSYDYDPNGLTNTSANATVAISPSDESKPEKCYDTMEKCRANCLTCSSKCASRPPPAMEEDRALHAVTTEAEP
ncbi:hypothetical protein PVAP13_4NG189722 [Panicum virgatum]|uniref:Uncharacterized protein n=1 Tax=Panicum virgatum TaxID=38727 RepID=A0A8T0TEP0_PANVG|nr:hypothetical protein PVAP13_4NG189722 [Panicum virgatum]